MKKYLFVMAALLAVAAACTKEEVRNDYEENLTAPVFKATVGEETKAVLDAGDGNKVKWDGTEHISVWNGTQTADYSTDDAGASADFTTSDDFASAGSYAALYPYDGSAVFSAGSVTTILPEAQTATAAGFDPTAHIAVTSSATTSLSFHNAVAYVKFTVPSGMDDLTSVSFKGNNSEKVAGACSVNTSTYALTATGSETATLSGSFTEGETYYLAVAPQAYSAGYTVTITRTSGTYEMVSKATSITFERTKARDIGNLWDGSIVLEGTAVAASTPMTVIGSPSNFTNLDRVYTYRGDLSTGKLTIRKSYSSSAVASNIDIPADGNYHIMYNYSTGRLRVYSQDIMTHFGKSTPMNNGAGTSYYPEDFTLNQFINNTSSPLSLYDYNGSATGVTMALDASAAVGTFNYTYENVKGSSGTRPNYSPWVNDDFYPNYGWGRAWSYSNTDKTSNSADILFTISGLDNSATYDVRVMGDRLNSSLNIRCASFKIGGSEVIIDNGLADGSTFSLTNFKEKVANFDGVSPSSSEIVVKMHSVTKHRDAQNDDFSECYINFIYISKVVYSQN